jgi:hypothetical protein
MEGRAYADDNGPRLFSVGWLGDGLSHWAHGREDHVRHYLSELAGMGYQVIYGFMEMEGGSFWEHESGLDLTVGPGITPGYYEHYKAYCRQVFSYGLKVAHCVADLTHSLSSQSARREHMRRLAECHGEIGEEHIAWVNVNEPNQIGASGPDEVIDFMNVYREATGGRVLTFHGAEQDENGDTIAAYARNASGWEEHTFRAGTYEQQVHHIFSLLREQHLHQRISWLCALTEGPGPGHPVSVGQQNHPEAVVMLRAMETCCKSPTLVFDGKGLWSHHHGDTFRNMPGRVEIPLMVAILNQFTGGKLHQYGNITHTGAAERTMTALDWQPGMRFDMFASNEEGKAVGLIYGEHMSSRIESTRGGTMRVLHPLTLQQDQINSGDRVEFDRGRIILQEW